MKKQNNSYASRHFSGKKQGKFPLKMGQPVKSQYRIHKFCKVFYIISHRALGFCSIFTTFHILDIFNIFCVKFDGAVQSDAFEIAN